MKFAPPTVRALFPEAPPEAPEAPAAELVVELEFEESAFDEPQAVSASPATATAAPRRRERRERRVEDRWRDGAVMVQVAFCVPCLPQACPVGL